LPSYFKGKVFQKLKHPQSPKLKLTPINQPGNEIRKLETRLISKTLFATKITHKG